MPTQKKDIDPSEDSDFGIEYAKKGQKWAIEKGVFVSGRDIAVYSEYNQSTLINKGDLVSLEGFAAQFTGQNATIINEKSGSMIGYSGVEFAESDIIRNPLVENYGDIRGLGANGVYAEDVSDFKLYNWGEIYGFGSAVYIVIGDESISKGPMIENSGLIHTGTSGEYFAVHADTHSGIKTTVVNKSDGVIKGTYAVVVEGGKLDLENKGKLKGNVYADNENDKVSNWGEIDGALFLNEGDDTYKNKGGEAGRIFSGDGDDELIAGKSKDKFVFDGPLDASTNVDRVKNFESGKDKFLLAGNVFEALTGPGGLENSEFHKGKNAQDANDHILYHKKTGKLWYDKDGDGDSAKVRIATLDEDQKLTADDFSVIVLA